MAVHHDETASLYAEKAGPVRRGSTLSRLPQFSPIIKHMTGFDIWQYPIYKAASGMLLSMAEKIAGMLTGTIGYRLLYYC
ncbi:MAG: hypothetical protein GXY20_12560 [Clostridiales bacterium]|nr:hypothetical protein [Clostridiales bacterium]